MSRTTSILIVVLAIVSACIPPMSARATELRSVDQMPALPPPDSEKITIANIGTATLSLLYMDGDWKTIQIPSGQYVTLPSQDTGLSVSFHDGVETKSTTLNRGTTNALYWNAGLNRWAIAPYSDVARRPSGFRSH
jgi:hypothetical protein